MNIKNKRALVSSILLVMSFALIYYYSNIATFIGVFLLIWANNICFSDSVRKVINDEIHK
jgi:hypothetical protein